MNLPDAHAVQVVSASALPAAAVYLPAAQAVLSAQLDWAAASVNFPVAHVAQLVSALALPAVAVYLPLAQTLSVAQSEFVGG